MTITVRPAPTPEQQAAAAARLAPRLDIPVGQSHAHNLLSILREHDRRAAS